MNQNTPITWHGVVDSQPIPMAEDPEHVTFRMRSQEGAFLEVFVPRTLVEATPGAFALNRAIAITGVSILAGQTPQTPIVVFCSKSKCGLRRQSNTTGGQTKEVTLRASGFAS